MTNDFEEVKSGRMANRATVDAAVDECLRGDVVDLMSGKAEGENKIYDALSDNMGRILDIAASVVEIEKMKTMTADYVKKLEEQRRLLTAEADAYVKKLNADTDKTVRKIDAIEKLMKDYYLHGTGKLPAEEFSRIISEIIDKIV